MHNIVGSLVSFKNENGQIIKGVILDKYVGVIEVYNDIPSTTSCSLSCKTHIPAEYYIIDSDTRAELYHVLGKDIILY